MVVTFSPRPRADFFFTGPLWQLATLTHLHRVLEDQIEDMLSRYEVDSSGNSARAGGVPAELQLMFIESRAAHAFRGPILLAIWSVVEATLIDTSIFFATRLAFPYSVATAPPQVPTSLRSKWKRWSVINRAKHFFAEQLSLVVFRSDADASRLEETRLIRNAIAHAGGRQHAMNATKWTRITHIANQRGDIQIASGELVLTPDFIRSELELATEVIGAFVVKARQALVQCQLDQKIHL